MRGMFDDVRKPAAALQIGLRADIALAIEQQVIGADEGGIVVQHLCRHRLAVQPLLQVGKGAGEIVGPRRAADQQLAIHHAFEIDRLEDIGKGAGNIVAGTGIEFSCPTGAGQLHANAVPFPFRGIVGRVQPIEIAIGHRRRQHHRVEDGWCRQHRPVRLALKPCEKRRIGRRQTVPEGLDLGDVFLRKIRQRLTRQPRRNADAQAAGCEFEESETRGRIEPVEQIAHRAAHLRAAE
ncbi:hypothetical protein D3C86_1159980 [compost metagenome]